MPNNVGTLVASAIRPFNTADTYPTAYASELLGGHKAVATIAERDAIPAARREIGTIVFVAATGESYYLSGGIANANWVLYVNPFYIAPISRVAAEMAITGVNVSIKKNGATGGGLTVEGASVFQGNISMTGGFTVTGTQNTSGDMTIGGNTDITGTLGVTGATTLRSTLQVNNISTFKNNATFETAVSMLSTLSVNAGVTLASTLGVTGAATLNSTLGVTGNTTVGGTLTSTGLATLNNGLTVTGATLLKSTVRAMGAADFDADVNVDGIITATSATFVGNVGISSALTVTGASTLQGAVTASTTLGVTGNTTLGGTLGLTGAATLASTLAVTGVTTLKDNVFIQKALDVTLGTTLHGALSVEGDTTLVKNGAVGGKITVGGAAVFNDTITMNAAATHNAATEFKGDVTITDKDLVLTKNVGSGLGGKITANGAALFNSTLQVVGNTTGTTATFSGATTLQSTLQVTGIATLKDNVNVEKALSVTGVSNFTGTGAFSNGVTVGTTLSVGTTLTVTGATTLNTTLNAKGAVDFDTTLNVDGITTLQAALNVNALATLSSLSVTNASTFNGAATAMTTLNVKGIATMENNLAVTGTSTLTGAVTAASTVTATGQIWGKAALLIDGAATLNNTVSMQQTLSVVGLTSGAGGFAVNSAVDGRGLSLGNNDAYKIYYSTSANATEGGKLDTTSDVNMYFRISGGTNRGFVFKNGLTPVFQIETGQVKSLNEIYVKNGASYSKLVREDQLGSGGGVSADMVDGLHADVDYQGTPNELAVYDANKRVYDSDRLDGYQAANSTGSIPISNGTVNVNLISDMVDGFHASQTVTANYIVVRDASSDVKTNTKMYFANSLIKDVSGALELRNLADTAWANLTVNNLTVKGTVMTINSETVTIDDNILLLNSNVTGAATENGGIQIERGTTGADASMIWDETADKWKAGLAGAEVELSLLGHTHVKANITDFAHKSTHAIGGNDVLTPADIGAIKNSGGMPEMLAGTEATRPAVGIPGRVYFATDTKRIWQEISGAWSVTGGQDTIDWANITNKPASFTTPIASATVLGGVKIGSGITVAGDGTISVGTNADTFFVRRKEFITTAGQVIFDLTTGSYIPGRNMVNVYLFGQKLPNSAYTETSGTRVTLNAAVDTGSLVEVEYTEVLDLYPYAAHANEHLPGGQDAIPIAGATAGLMSAAQATKLTGVSTSAKKVAVSGTNGNILIDDVETQVFRSTTYVHTQGTAAITWTITHNLNRYPSVTVVDVNNDVFIPSNIRYNSANQITVTFSVAESGKAFLN